MAPSSQRKTLSTTASVVIILSVALFIVVRPQTSDTENRGSVGPVTTTPAPSAVKSAGPTTTQDPNLLPVKEGSTLTATPKGKIQGYDAPNGTPTIEVTNTYYEVYTALPVFEQSKGWLHVRLPTKPNGQTAWVKVLDVDVGSTPYRVVINLATKRLRLYKDGMQVVSAPVGIGTADTPSVTGDYFVTFLQLPPKDPATGKPDQSYGPFEIVTSAHSDVLKEWQGFPDGILAIHGPLDSDAAIGKLGTLISNGCVRMHVVDLQKLADVQPGSPVEINSA